VLQLGRPGGRHSIEKTLFFLEICMENMHKVSEQNASFGTNIGEHRGKNTRNISTGQIMPRLFCICNFSKLRYKIPFRSADAVCFL
jgi:hypothetical protein